MVNYGIVANLVEIIIKVQNDKVLNEAFITMETLFDQGNIHAQSELARCLGYKEERGGDDDDDSSMEDSDDDEDFSNEFQVSIMASIEKESTSLKKLCTARRESQLANWFGQKKDQKEGTEPEDDHEQQHLDQIKQHCQSLCQYFSVLQLFCEGHFKPLQNLLREQNTETNAQQVNFYHTGVILYGSLIQFLNENTKDLILQVLDFLIEAVQGPNKQNQEFLFKSKFFEFFKDYIVDYSDNEEIFRNEEKSNLIEEIIRFSIAFFAACQLHL